MEVIKFILTFNFKLYVLLRNDEFLTPDFHYDQMRYLIYNIKKIDSYGSKFLLIQVSQPQSSLGFFSLLEIFITYKQIYFSIFYIVGSELYILFLTFFLNNDQDLSISVKKKCSLIFFTVNNGLLYQCSLIYVRRQEWTFRIFSIFCL